MLAWSNSLYQSLALVTERIHNGCVLVPIVGRQVYVSPSWLPTRLLSLACELVNTANFHSGIWNSAAAQTVTALFYTHYHWCNSMWLTYITTYRKTHASKRITQCEVSLWRLLSEDSCDMDPPVKRSPLPPLLPSCNLVCCVWAFSSSILSCWRSNRMMTKRQ